ncbi:hypothetical protein BJV85_000288 [Clostridium acetobutylicum]|uniref:Uncharacterized protein n=1 Tax=Clostridium acetobutylicum (strain ATCC 824 / DSM 792 / JCM 1419 / IAM 19013 / LMG 5710 / NBRC 13948 / NRRL B-527 / VKM B-1787 / 2291 / W) TaxID=272562 RepID=Q97D68_CLOAB|nr:MULTISPECIES: hypothetical protein [Clostridium]AAK81535.1 Hypothetical protein CA_C3612 [Clostridium acetobutylicum ATCC 824]ADZ22656.1 Conserved hypothetical protein [Clostridium acetobutylicum EA 2018]AEI32957.1 hypothetical protein SMB_G3653 [Clostridium acetobutylicum DSM 1731]AWV80792.1 hypothetical protein DK921_11900 [Clostridium acetobutylicum]MBC2393883.1 hypothetical protein [Clostridium acetobutylicum]
MKNLKKKLLSAGVILSVTLGASLPVLANNYVTSDYFVYGNGSNWQASLTVEPGQARTTTYANPGTSVHVYTRCTASNGNTLNAFGEMNGANALVATTGYVNGTAWNGYHGVYDLNGTVHVASPADGEFWQ